MTVKRMDNVGIVVEDIDAAIKFFTELGLTLEGRMPIEGANGPAASPECAASASDRHDAHPRRPQPPRSPPSTPPIAPITAQPL